MNIIKKIDECKLNDNEREISNWMKMHLEDIPKMSSRQLAKLTYSNPTTILRICKKLGFENFNDLKCQIVLFIENDNEKYKLSKNDDLVSINLKVSSLHKNIINKIQREISKDQMQKIYKLIDQYLYIDFIVGQYDKTLAFYGADMFFTAHKICYVYTELSKQMILTQNVTKDHLVIFLSREEENKEFVKMAKILKKRGITDIAFTVQENHLLKTHCMYSVYGISSREQYEFMTFSLSVMYIFNLLTAMLISDY